jgi:hypothetical protein
MAQDLKKYLVTRRYFMKSFIFILATLISVSNVLASNDVTFTIDRLIVADQGGTIETKSFVILSDGDEIKYKNEIPFLGKVSISQNKLLILGENGLSMKTSSPVSIKEFPKTDLEEGVLISNDKGVSLTARHLNTSVSSFVIDVINLNFNCIDGGDCHAKASKLMLDNNLKITIPTFRCKKVGCLNDFMLTLDNLTSDQTFKLTHSQNKSLVELKDLSGIVLKRTNAEVTLDGKLQIAIIGKLGFAVRAHIDSLSDEDMVLSINNVKVADILSVTDFTMFLVRKLLGGKSYAINGNQIHIKLK